MRIAIMHYHLRPGGVTRVIQNALSALHETDVHPLIFAGEPPSPSMHVEPYTVIEGLGYHDDTTRRSPEEIVADLLVEAERHLGGLPDLWHIHNHSLGKNLVMPDIVSLLSQKGHRLLLQIHDFAEDGRPANYTFLRDHLCPDEPGKLGSRLYLQGTHIHYALLNHRDLTFLRHAGVPPDQLHHLPNPVNMEPAKSATSQDTAEHLFLYPVRAIRRKNVGEFLLWACLAQEGERFAITRAPQNPNARPVYDDWVAFAQELQLPVAFGFGETWQGSFSDLLASASALVTTSVAEGFGLAFLEPWLFLSPLVGRKLTEITGEFEHIGVDVSTLYERLDVPLEWVGRERFEQAVRTALTTAYGAYDRTPQEDDVERAVNASLAGTCVDFGKLHEPFQQDVIRRLHDDPAARSVIRPATLFQRTGQLHDLLQQNRRTIEEHYNLATYTKRLVEIYRAVAGSDISGVSELDAQQLLDQFLAPERFCLLRT